MKNLNKLAICTVLLSPVLLSAQSLGITSGAKTLVDELASSFPYIVVILFLFVGWKNLSHFGKEGDTMEGVKNILMYVLLVVIIVGIYQFLIKKSL